MSYPKPRQIAIDVLTLSQKTKVPVESLLGNALKDAKLNPNDSNLCRELVSGCVRWRRLLDWLINRHTKKPKQKPIIQEILRLGLYQIFFLNRIPEHAIVNESVILAKVNNHTRQSGFINALMRRFLKEKESVFKIISHLQDEQPALGLSHPDWLFEKWEQQWGREKAIRLLEWNNQPAPTYARLNQLNKETEILIERWESEKVEAIPFDCDWARKGTIYQLRKHPKIETLQSFRDGLFYIQDPSTLLSINFLKPQSGQKILDLCAAPGGKTSLIADQINNHGEITSTDIHKSRLALIQENCKRLNITCVKVGLAEEILTNKENFFDRVLVDAPCTNSGVIRRRLDSRWRMNLNMKKSLAETQFKLLEKASYLTKPDGLIVYSTCSIEPEENELIVNQFLKKHPEWELECDRTLHPVEDHTDGAYSARLSKNTTKNPASSSSEQT